MDELQVALADAESERDSLSERVKEHEKLAAHAANLEERNTNLEKVWQFLPCRANFFLRCCVNLGCQVKFNATLCLLKIKIHFRLYILIRGSIF